MTTFSEDFDIAILEIYNIYNKMGKIVLGHVESSYRQNSVNEDDHELDKVKKITNTLCDTKLIIEELVFTKYADRAYADSGFPQKDPYTIIFGDQRDRMSDQIANLEHDTQTHLEQIEDLKVQILKKDENISRLQKLGETEKISKNKQAETHEKEQEKQEFIRRSSVKEIDSLKLNLKDANDTKTRLDQQRQEIEATKRLNEQVKINNEKNTKQIELDQSKNRQL